MWWVVTIGLVGLTGCSGQETPYQTRLRYVCGAGDKVACESARSLKDEPARSRSGPDLSGVGGFLLDVGAALPFPR